MIPAFQFVVPTTWLNTEMWLRNGARIIASFAPSNIAGDATNRKLRRL
jgi:hypothetical protein